MEGYVAHIAKRPDAVPRVSQPFPLSAYDQARLDFHEDCEVEDGKAEWVKHGALVHL